MSFHPRMEGLTFIPALSGNATYGPPGCVTLARRFSRRMSRDTAVEARQALVSSDGFATLSLFAALLFLSRFDLRIVDSSGINGLRLRRPFHGQCTPRGSTSPRHRRAFALFTQRETSTSSSRMMPWSARSMSSRNFLSGATRSSHCSAGKEHIPAPGISRAPQTPNAGREGRKCGCVRS